MSERKFSPTSLVNFLKSSIVKTDQPEPRMRSGKLPFKTPPTSQRGRVESFSDLELGYISCKTIASNIPSSKTHASKAESWIETIDGKLEGIAKAREKWDAKCRQDQRWESILAATDEPTGMKVMGRQVRELRQLCVGVLSKLVKHPELIDEPLYRDRDETHGAEVERILEKAFDAYFRAHDDMRQAQWDALVANDVQG